MEQLVDPWAEYSFTHVFCELFKYGKRGPCSFIYFTLRQSSVQWQTEGGLGPRLPPPFEEIRNME